MREYKIRDGRKMFPPSKGGKREEREKGETKTKKKKTKYEYIAGEKKKRQRKNRLINIFRDGQRCFTVPRY